MDILDIFTQILRMGSVASVVILAVFLVRILMRRFPRKYAYLLWLIVGIRLVCPVAVPSSLSVFNLPVTQEQNSILMKPQEKSSVSTKPKEQNNVSAKPQQETVVGQSGETHESGTDLPEPGEETSGKAADQSVDAVKPMAELPALSSAGDGQASSDKEEDTADDSSRTDVYPSAVRRLLPAASYIWLVGMALLLLWNVYLMMRMKRWLGKAVLYRDNIYECDGIASPFVLGLFRPRIYIPFRLGERECMFILQHEQYHIRRRDYIIKFFAFLILAVYWFHPLVWAAYFCMIRDMEMSCDEHVLASMGEDVREEYSRTLLAFAVNRRRLSVGLPAFGETDTRRRIRHILNFHKKGKWMGILAGVIIVVAAIVCLTNKKSVAIQEPRTEISSAEINGYETKLLLGNGKKVEDEASPYQGMYEGRFVLATYNKEGEKCDERELDVWDNTFDGQEMLYFPEKISLCVRDYDGDGKIDDFALGQRPGGSQPGNGTAMMYSFYTVEENGSIMKYNVQKPQTLPEEYPEYITVDKWGEYSPEFPTENGGLVYRFPDQSVEGLDIQNAKLSKRIEEGRLPESELAVFRDVEKRLNRLSEIYPQQILEEIQNGSRMVTWMEGVENYHIVYGRQGEKTVAIQVEIKDGKLFSYDIYINKEIKEKLPEVMRELTTNDPDGISRWMEEVVEDQYEPIQRFARAFCGRTVERKDLRRHPQEESVTSSMLSDRDRLCYSFADMQGGIYTINKVYGIVERFEESGLVGMSSDDPALEKMEDQVKIGIWRPEDGTNEPTYFAGGEDMEKLQALAEQLDPDYGCTSEMEEMLQKQRDTGYVLSYKGNIWSVSMGGYFSLLYGKDEKEDPGQNAVMYLPELYECAEFIRAAHLYYGWRYPSRIENLISAELSYRKKDGTYVKQTLTKKSKLQILEDVLSKAEDIKGAPACPFGTAVLTLERRDGTKIPLTWADDNCRVIRVDGVCFEYKDQHLSFDPNGIRALFDKIPWKGLADEANKDLTETQEPEQEKTTEDLVMEYTRKMMPRTDLSHDDPAFDNHFNMDYYGKVVDIGFDAVEILTDEKNFNQLNPYAVWLTVSQITGCEYWDWETDDEIFESWNSLVASALSEMTKIITSGDLRMGEKVINIRNYGFFGEVFIQDVLSKGKDSEMLRGNGDVELKLSKKFKKRLKKIVKSDPSELKKVRTYLLERSR